MIVPTDFSEARRGQKGPVITGVTGGLLQTPTEAAAAEQVLLSLLLHL